MGNENRREQIPNGKWGATVLVAERQWPTWYIKIEHKEDLQDLGQSNRRVSA